MAVSDEEYAILSNAVYRDADFISPENYKFEEIPDLHMSDNKTEFYAEAYRHKPENEVVIAYRGTANLLNIIHDFEMWRGGKKPPEFDMAMEYYHRVKAYCDDKSLSLIGMTGHSLGGSMVQYVNAMLATKEGYQIQGVAFAPAGVGEFFPDIDPNDKSIFVTNYIREGDPIPEKMNKQLGNSTESLSKTDQSYSVQFSEGVGEILSRFEPGGLTPHRMLGYLVDVAQLPTIPIGNGEAFAEYCRKAKYAVNEKGINSGIEMDKQIAIQMFAQGYSRDNIRYALENASAGLSIAEDPAEYIEEILRTNLIVNRYAAGGHLESGQVSGPGTGTSDSILAWLGNKGRFIRISNGEYVIRANAVQKWGTNFLDNINNGLIPQDFYNGKDSYAVGGSISDNFVEGSQGNLGEALRNLVLTVIHSIQNYVQELMKQTRSELGLNATVVKSSAFGTLSNGTKISQDFGFKPDASGNSSDAPQQADYNHELAKTPSLLERIYEASKKTFEAGLSNFLTEGIMKSKNLGEAFRNLAVSVLQSIQKIYAEAVAKNIMSMLGIGDQASRPTVNGTVVQGPLKEDGTFAKGGHIQGPGTGTSDSILARLSDGEFVIKASSVRKYGTNFLYSLNNGFVPNHLMPRFATGGLVGASVEGASAIASNIQSGDVTVPLKVVNVTDPNEVGRYLKTRSGERIMVNFMKNNAGTMRQILNVKG